MGLIVPDIQNPTFAEIASKIEQLARKEGYSTFLCNANEVPENEKFYLQVLFDRQVDGIIISPIHTKEWTDMEAVRSRIPMVLISRIFTRTEMPWVTSDNAGAAATMTGELIKLGYRRIAYLGGTRDSYINSVRFRGYREAFRAHSLDVDMDAVLFKGYTPRAGEEMMEKVLERVPDVEAVFCVNNMVFFGAMKVLQQVESREKRSLMVAAFDIGRYSRVIRRPLVSANQDFTRMAESAVQLLIDRIEGRPREEHHLVLPVKVEKYHLS